MRVPLWGQVGGECESLSAGAQIEPRHVVTFLVVGRIWSAGWASGEHRDGALVAYAWNTRVEGVLNWARHGVLDLCALRLMGTREDGDCALTVLWVQIQT
jgi:hypothetical protein